MSNIKKVHVYEAETLSGTPIEFRYNGSLTINVYIVDVKGCRHEADVIMLAESGVVKARRAIERYMEQEQAYLQDQV